jgi:hypothetical protein
MNNLIIATDYFPDPETSMTLAIHNVLTNGQQEVAVEDKTPEEQPDEKQETPSETDTPSPVTPETDTKRGSWTGNEPIQSSPRHAKMLFKTRTLSALPLNPKPKTAFESRLIASFKQRSIDDNYMRNNFDNDEETALYFKLLFFGCSCMLVWKHIWLLPVMLFFLAIHVMKRLLEYFGVWLFFENHYNSVMARINVWWADR